MIQAFELGSRGLVPLSAEGKNELQPGTILHLNGYDNPDYVIVRNEGVSKSFPSSGARYLTVKLSDHGQSWRDAYGLKHLREKQDNRIQVYITERVMPADELAEIWEASEAKRERSEQLQEEAQRKRLERIELGKALFAKHIPADAKAVIVAEFHEDESDSQTDYFGHRTIGKVILGWSKHTRDLFPEMRKHATAIPETAHLRRVPAVNSNGDSKTEGNAAYWNPADEHREKYSMGAGYYLKDGYRHSTGWSICKIRKYDDWNEDLYLAMGKRCTF